MVVYAIEEGKKLGLCASGNNAVCLLSDDKGHDILTIKRIPWMKIYFIIGRIFIYIHRSYYFFTIPMILYI